MNVTVLDLLIPEHQDTVETRLFRRFLERVPTHRMEDVILRLMRDFGHEDTDAQEARGADRIARRGQIDDGGNVGQ